MPERVPPTKFVVVQVIGDRNYPIARIQLPTHVVEDLSNLLETALKLNPTMGYEQVIRGIWRHGSRMVRNNLARGIVPNDAVLPPAAIVPVKDDSRTQDGSRTEAVGDSSRTAFSPENPNPGGSTSGPELPPSGDAVYKP